MTSQFAEPGFGSAAVDGACGQRRWRSALRKFRRDRIAMGAGACLLLIVLGALAAPLYPSLVSHNDPFHSGLNVKIVVDGRLVPVMQPSTTGLRLGVTPIGPTWQPSYFLGADNQGRDVAARMFYGGRSSLLIAGAATFLCLALAGLVGFVSGYWGGVVDMVLSRILDILWAFPAYLLAISLSIVLISQTMVIGPFVIRSGSLLMPIFVLGIIYVPYVARPIRGQVLSLRRSEFVLASIGLGLPRWRIILHDILPNVLPTLLVFMPLMMALNIVTESALSFLSIGVQPPGASWGTIIQDGQALLYTRPAVSLAPGLAIAVTVIALNLFGEGLREVLDPRTKLRKG
ncbi:ABC transporter permease [Mesorhizobium sp. LSHC422A00]|uniref:ABC transporter permease n=1 Tax=Mesorhizobium sp. LSHC422A00 TaxID=1287294 RepID=UPI0004CFAEBB|nr:ABC transporter permease [Mesorhizobium sp. LSHC422A00]